jgi:general secretion pathway protein H
MCTGYRRGNGTPLIPTRAGERRWGVLAGKGGFTLVELLVVVILLTIATGLVSVAVSSGIQGVRERRIQVQLQNELQRARIKAMSSRKTIRFVIDGGERVFSFEGGEVHHIPESVQVEGEGIQDFSPSLAGLSFYPDGSSSGGILALRPKDGSEFRFEIDKVFGFVTLSTEEP